MKKVGIIRCQQTEDLCPSTACLRVASMGKHAFEEYGPCEIIGIVSCGGCPGKRAVARANVMIERGADIIAFATCIFKGTPIAFPCPHAEQIKQSVRKKIGDTPIILDFTHK
jgi:Predicted metal-binding protein